MNHHCFPRLFFLHHDGKTFFSTISFSSQAEWIGMEFRFVITLFAILATQHSFEAVNTWVRKVFYACLWKHDLLLEMVLRVANWLLHKKCTQALYTTKHVNPYLHFCIDLKPRGSYLLSVLAVRDFQLLIESYWFFANTRAWIRASHPSENQLYSVVLLKAPVLCPPLLLAILCDLCVFSSCEKATTDVSLYVFYRDVWRELSQKCSCRKQIIKSF